MKKLIPLYISLILSSCGSDNNDSPSSVVTTLEHSTVKELTCSDWSEQTQETFHKCIEEGEGLGIIDMAYLNDELFTHIEKFRILKSPTKDTFQKIVHYKNLHADASFQGSFFDSNPTAVSKIVIHEEGKEDITLLDPETDEVFDFTIFDQKIYILFHDEKNKKDSELKVAIYKANGDLQSEYSLHDPGLFSDSCKEVEFLLNICFEEDEEETSILAFPPSARKYAFSQSSEAAISIHEETGDLMIYVNTLYRSSGNLYRYHLSPQGLNQKMRSQIFPNAKVNEGFPISLLGGSEIFAFNRHARFHQKFILPLKEETIIIAYVGALEIIKHLNVDLSLAREFANERGLSDEDFNYIRHLVAVSVDNKSGAIKKAKTISIVSDFADTFSRPLIHKGRIYLTHTQRQGSSDSTSRFHPFLISFDAKTLENRESIKLPFIDETKASLVMDSTASQDEIFLSGRMNFTQNPSGESISLAGHAFIARYNLSDKSFQVKQFNYSERKEVVTSLFYDKENEKLFYGLTFDGPDTHSGDSLVSGVKQYSTVLELKDFHY